MCSCVCGCRRTNVLWIVIGWSLEKTRPSKRRQKCPPKISPPEQNVNPVLTAKKADACGWSVYLVNWPAHASRTANRLQSSVECAHYSHMRISASVFGVRALSVFVSECSHSRRQRRRRHCGGAGWHMPVCAFECVLAIWQYLQ